MQTAERVEKMPFLSMVTLTFDQRYFIHKQNPQTDNAKNRTFHSSLYAVTSERRS